MERSTSSFQPIPNPYIVGNPIKDRVMFFGREDDFAYIQNKFSGGKEGGLIVLCGARRSGKTSILFQIQAGRLGEGFLPVLIDMQSMAIRSNKDFLGKLDAAIVGAGFHPEIKAMHSEIAEQHDNPFTVSEQLVVRLSAECRGKSLVLMFDEYELIETHIDSGVITTQILNLLASLVEHRRVFVVFTGSDKLSDRNKPYWDMFLSKALHRRISFLSRRDTHRLISEPVAGRVRYAAGIPERIAALTAGQPFYTQVVCQTLVDHLNEAQKLDVESADLDTVVGEVIENPLPQMIFSWNTLTHLERLALAIIAALSKDGVRPIDAESILSYAREERIGFDIDSGELNKTLEGLFHSDLLDKAGDGSGFTIRMDLWRLWVTRMHSVWQVVDEIGKAGESRGAGLTISKKSAPAHRGSVVKWVSIVMVVLAVVVLSRGRFGNRADRVRTDGRSGQAAISGNGAPVDSGKLAVTSAPAGAEVYLGGALLGRTPLDQRVPARRGVVTVAQPGYKDGVDSIDLASSDSARLHFSLVERVGAARISSTPPGAEILLDGARSGATTPVTLDALPVARLHEVTLTLAGFAPRTFGAVRVVEDSVVELAHTFSREMHSLKISSEPAGAAIFLDGANVGETPYIVAQVASGSHTLRLVKEGFAEATQTIEVPHADLSVALTPLTPGVIVFSVQPYAEVLIDGRPAGDHTITYLSVLRPPGDYSIELKHPEFASQTSVVHVTPGDTVRVNHSFLATGSGQ